jgi:hypothetical protein
MVKPLLILLGKVSGKPHEVSQVTHPPEWARPFHGIKLWGGGRFKNYKEIHVQQTHSDHWKILWYMWSRKWHDLSAQNLMRDLMLDRGQVWSRVLTCSLLIEWNIKCRYSCLQRYSKQPLANQPGQSKDNWGRAGSSNPANCKKMN